MHSIAYIHTYIHSMYVFHSGLDSRNDDPKLILDSGQESFFSAWMLVPPTESNHKNYRLPLTQDDFLQSFDSVT